MQMKVCVYCGRDSYSATDRYPWVCPYCGSDISDTQVELIQGEVGDDREDAAADGDEDS
ncbi:MAG: hypothetical protein WD535_04440 [Thermaerobacterales bacterium]